MTRSIVIGTAGHIDHGKSTLVRALTGTDPDRLKEEQQRGITIDLGFAHATIGGQEVAFVDVPGHEKFVRHMLAGAGAIDAVLLVVDAAESVMPQTREHFEICRLLGLTRAIVALTKRDLVDDETAALAALDVRELLAPSGMADAPIVPVSARTGAGLDALRDAIAHLAEDARAARAQVARLPIDRAFVVKGFGTVVTGTLVSGRVCDGDVLTVWPDGREVRVRGLQVHGRSTPEARAPRRLAVNLGAIDVASLPRGTTIATARALTGTRRIDARVEVLRDARPLRHGALVRVHQGTSDVEGRVAICAVCGDDGEWRQAGVGEAGVSAPAGSQAFIRLRLAAPLAVTRGDRFVLRSASPARTVAGGMIVDPAAPWLGLRRPGTLLRFVAMDDAGDAARMWLTEAGERGLDASQLVARGGVDPDAARATIEAWTAAGVAEPFGVDRAIAAEVWRTATDGITAALAADHRDHPDEAGLAREALRERVRLPPDAFDRIVAALVASGAIRDGERVALASHAPRVADRDVRVRQIVATAMADAGLTPPDAATLAASSGCGVPEVERALHALAKARTLVRIDTLFFDAARLAALKADLRALAHGTPQTSVDVATFKTRYGLTRKYAIPLLEWLDRERVTRRDGPRRVVLAG